MATKRIYQIAKELECDEKKIIEFLTTQGIKVANRLSAVSEESYNLLKAKLLAPPEPPPPPPPPAPAPEPKPAEKPAPAAPAAPPQPADEKAPDQAAFKKKKKGKSKFQAAEEREAQFKELMPVNVEEVKAATQLISGAGLDAGNDFLKSYTPLSKVKNKDRRTHLSRQMDVWGLLQDITFDYPETSPIRYWQAVNKLTTSAYRQLQEYGLRNREILAEMRETMKIVGSKFEPQEIFTDEENQRFAEQQDFLFRTFSHGMGAVNDELYKLKMYAERKKVSFEHMDFVEYIKNPEGSLETKIPMPFEVLAEAIAYSIRSVPCHTVFYSRNKELVVKTLENFFAWIEGYKKLKEQGADAAKLEKYLVLEDKLFMLIEFMSLDNLVTVKRSKKATVFEILLDLLNGYRDNMDDPDAERNFKYKVRGITNITYKPKEYVFLFQFADLEPNKDYRPAGMEEDPDAAEENIDVPPEEPQEESPAEEPDEA